MHFNFNLIVWVILIVALIRSRLHEIQFRKTKRELLRTKNQLQENRLLFSKIEHMALHDSLTALPNRNLFEELSSNALAKARRQKSMLGVMFIDLDKFKSVNDTFGHAPCVRISVVGTEGKYP